jgi:hypothetical protein
MGLEGGIGENKTNKFVSNFIYSTIWGMRVILNYSSYSRIVKQVF